MKEYICVRCGKKFKSNHKKAVCDDCHTGICVVCGKEFQLQYPWTQKTCSIECRSKYVVSSGISKKRRFYAEKTNKARYGISTVPQNFKPRNCAYCGESFTPTSNRQVYCNRTHYGPCPVCGKPVEIKEMSIGPTTCSTECELIMRKETNLRKYGHTNYLCSDEGKAEIKKASLLNYGADHPWKSDEVRAKIYDTNIEKYGVPIAMQNAKVSAKAKATNLVRYGGASPTCDTIVKEKAKASAIKRYGGIGFGSPETNKKIQDTMLAKYGVRHSGKSPEIRDKAKQTCKNRYGTVNYNSSDIGIARRMTDGNQIHKFLEFKEAPRKYLETHYTSYPTLTQLAKDLGVTDILTSKYILDNKCTDLIDYHSSSIELEVINYIKSTVPGIEVIHNNKSVIYPQEIDIYLPEYKLGIECNPTITNNSSIQDPWGQDPKPYKYHMKKSQACKSAGVELFHIFGYEWKHKQDVIKSMLANRLGVTQNTIYARKTRVYEIDYKSCVKFLNENHLQGMTSAGVRLGLVYDGELVAVMTFNKMRSTIGQGAGNSYELSRFCNKLNTHVVGGASKLLAYYMREYNTDLVSFSDNAHTTGKLYERLGFIQDHDVDPRYLWVDLSNEQTINRLNTQKRNLRKLFNDPTIDIENKTEREIMIEHGYVQVFDSGLTKWVLNKKI